MPNEKQALELLEKALANLHKMTRKEVALLIEGTEIDLRMALIYAIHALKGQIDDEENG